jgi:hypothetical protein
VVELAEYVVGESSDRVFGGNAEQFYRLPKP